jgi:hypothetical protein
MYTHYCAVHTNILDILTGNKFSFCHLCFIYCEFLIRCILILHSLMEVSFIHITPGTWYLVWNIILKIPVCHKSILFIINVYSDSVRSHNCYVGCKILYHYLFAYQEEGNTVIIMLLIFSLVKLGLWPYLSFHIRYVFYKAIFLWCNILDVYVVWQLLQDVLYYVNGSECTCISWIYK